ncbi:hypothetical protein QUA35_06330 [Microcoleus sp. N9_B2]|uniref:hypothetical protein n=1 Tax=unclassified Microcoleus TaxID=2642155 RepID=UPI002FD648C7
MSLLHRQTSQGISIARSHPIRPKPCDAALEVPPPCPELRRFVSVGRSVAVEFLSLELFAD